MLVEGAEVRVTLNKDEWMPPVLRAALGKIGELEGDNINIIYSTIQVAGSSDMTVVIQPQPRKDHDGNEE